MAVLGEEIILPGRSSSPTPVLSPGRENGGAGSSLCSLCLSGPATYTCPRCNAPYCSLACYRGPRHTACSELFYREAVLQALREEETGPRGRRQLQDTLLALKEEEETAGEPGHIGETEAALWNRLSVCEKEHFNKLMKSGDIGALVPQWKAWWDLPETRCKKICELPEGERRSGDVLEMTETARRIPTPAPSQQDQESSEEVEEKSGVHKQARVPPVMSPIPPLCSLCHNPSPLVRYTLVNVIYGYAFSLLRHNGEIGDMLLDFIGTLFSVSGVLSTTAVYPSTAHALKSAMRAASDPQLGGNESLACSAMEATSHILQGDGSKRYPLAAISHLYNLLAKVRRQVPTEKDIRKGAFSAKKKCLFLAAWVNENEDCLRMLAGEVLAEYKQYLDDLSGVTEIARGLQKVWGGKRPPEKQKLIQEMHQCGQKL